MKRIVAQAIILARTDYGEADRILTVITPDFGKMKLMAKGVRRAKSKMAGGIELFGIADLTIMLGRSEIHTLLSSRLKSYWGNITSDIDRTMLGYEVLKTINKVTEDTSEQEYFDLLSSSLSGLNDLDLDIRLLELWFTMRLLKITGHSPNLNLDINQTQLQTGLHYSFDIASAAFESSTSGEYQPSHIKLLRLGHGFDDPRQFRNLTNAEGQVDQSLKLSKTMLSYFLQI